MSTIIDSIEKEQLRRVPRFQAGDRVRVHFRVVEGTRTRTQVFEGVVIKRQGSGVRETFTVRKQSFGVGVERTFPLHSPKIEKLEVAARGDVRRAKLYYLRDRVGKAARVAERRWGIEDDLLDSEEGPVDAEGEVQEEAEVEVTPAEGEGAEAEGSGEADEAGDAGEAPEAEADDSEQGEPAAEAESDASEASAEEAQAEDEAEDAGSDDAGEADDQAGESQEDSTEDEASERDG